ncbi:MAG TPA: SHOCT domain-containing protein [Solirubrobacteraceae bacterium]
MFGKHTRLERKLREAGRTAPATVLECHGSITITKGNEMIVSNTQVVCRLRLQVSPPGEPTFEAETSARFSQFAMPGQGATLQVPYDPEDHDKVVVDESPEAQTQAATSNQIATFRTMGGDLGAAIADKLEAAQAAGRLNLTGDDEQAIQAYNAEFAKVVREAKEGLGLSGPVVSVNGQIISAGGGAGAAPAPAAADPVDEIRKLADLRDRGALTQAEFAAQKAKLLERL